MERRHLSFERRTQLTRQIPRVGRPSKYRPEFCEDIISAGMEGYSFAAFAGSIPVSISTATEWTQHYPEFRLAKSVAEACAVMWWEARLRDLVCGAKGNVTAAIFGLKNRAKDYWRDTYDHKHGTGADGPVRVSLDVSDLRGMMERSAEGSVEKMRMLEEVLAMIQAGATPSSDSEEVRAASAEDYARTLEGSNSGNGRWHA